MQRETQQLDLTVQRGRIELESVIGDYRDDDNRWIFRLRDDPSIAYVRLTGFGDRTVGELETVLKELDNDFAALVLDLRGNGGGLLHAAVDISNMFLNTGRIVSTRTRGGKIEDRFNADPGTLVDPRKPVAVLIDSNSASASEIVAACLQDHDRAAIVGLAELRQGDRAEHFATAIRPQCAAIDGGSLLSPQWGKHSSKQRGDRNRTVGCDARRRPRWSNSMTRVCVNLPSAGERLPTPR